MAGKSKTVIIIVSILGGLFVFACIGMVVIASLMSTTDDSSTKESSATSTSSDSEEAKQEENKNYKIGETVKVGKTEWKILEVKDIGNTLKSDNEFIESKETNGRFIKVRVYVKNLASEPESISGFALIDSKDQKFDPYTESSMYIPEKEQLFFEQLNPQIGKKMQEIFEVPKEAKNLKIRLYDLNDSFSDNVAYVDTKL